MSERTDKIRRLADLAAEGPDENAGEMAMGLRLIADELDSLGTRVLEQDVEQLFAQLRCGVTDPATDPDHPGYMLLHLGWTLHEPDDQYGNEWSPPGATDRFSLPTALGMALRAALEAAPAGTMLPASYMREH